MNVDPEGMSWWSDFWEGVGNWFSKNWQWIAGTAIIVASYIAEKDVLVHNVCGEILDKVPDGYEPTYKNGVYDPIQNMAWCSMEDQVRDYLLSMDSMRWITLYLIPREEKHCMHIMEKILYSLCQASQTKLYGMDFLLR